MEQPIEEPMRNKEEKVEVFSLASRKAYRNQQLFFFSLTLSQLLSCLIGCLVMS